MSNCSPNSISPSSSGGEFQKPDTNSMIGGLNRSPAHATSVPSHHCAVSPQDEASNDGLNKNKTFYFTSSMANEAVAEIGFETLLSWYLRKKEKSQSNGNSASDRKRKARTSDVTETKRSREATATTVDDIQKLIKEEPRDDHPLKQMERMTNLSALEPSGIKEVVASSCGKNKEAERERNAKLEKLGEIENTLAASQPTNYPGLQKQPSEPHLLAPNAGKEEWERIVGTGSAPSTSTASTTQCPPPAQFSPMYAPPTAPLSAGSYPAPFLPYPAPHTGLGGPASAGSYPTNPAAKQANNCSMATNGPPRMMPAMPPMCYPGYPPYANWRPGMPYPMPQNPAAYAQWHQQAMAKGAGNLSPGAFHPQLPGGAIPANIPGYPPNMLVPGRMSHPMGPAPPYVYPGMPPHAGYQPPPGAMYPGMMVPRPGMPVDPSMNPYANFSQMQALEKEASSKSDETTVSDPVVAAS